MTRSFPLAGLLRLRKLEEDQSASTLSRARVQAAEQSHRSRSARAAFADSDSGATSPAMLAAIAASRASAVTMFAELTELERQHDMEVELARVAHERAHARALGLEKLEERHDEAVAAEELRAEQIVLDELAARAWHIAHTEETS
jgi:flagellar protein FliJ